ncbi:MAG: hypothetical protein PHT41_02365 [Candidatus Omnitrophica bacterium]|nr:hypothetical protein [Candidatus Omnitrophota bacterium]
MEADKILNEIIAIEPNNLFLQYIASRIQDPDYRGLHISQHNRYDLDRLTRILTGVYDIVGNNIFRIPLGDDTGKHESGCDEYYKVVTNVNNEAGVGTINSLKKNFFVDFQQMGLLDRFDKKSNSIPLDKRGHVYYARLTDRSIRLVVTDSITEKYRIFTDSLDALFANEITNIAQTLYYSKYKDDAIGILEFMLILSDDRPYITEDKINLIDSFRILKRWQQDRAVALIKQYCNPRKLVGNKRMQRDFGNWKNESQQIFTLLKNTVYFDITQNSLRLNTGRYGIFAAAQVKQRSLGAKQEYFKKHCLKKIINFELHHVIPFSSARNKVEFKLIDNWKNLIYLMQKKHAEITRKGDRNIVMYATKEHIYFDDFYKNRIVAQNGKDVTYEGQLSAAMEKYNREILKEIFGYPK